MRNLILMTLTMLSLTAQAGTVIDQMESTQDMSLSPLATSVMTTWITACTIDECKVVVEAQEDLAYFVASEGAVRTAKFESIVTWARSNFELSSANDLAVAQALLGTLATPR